jgi:hypothetical protein
MLRVIDKGVDAGCEMPNYYRAIDTLFFSLSTDPTVRHTIAAAKRYKFECWIASLARAKALKPWVDKAKAAQDLLLMEAALIHEWCIGEFEESEQRYRRKLQFLMMSLAIVGDPVSSAIERATRRLHARMGVLRTRQS